MTTYLDRYLAGEREAVWTELTALGSTIRDNPLAADAQAVAHETMRRARANVELLAQRLTTLNYRFVGKVLSDPPIPHIPPNDESLAALRSVQEQYGQLPLSLQMWYQIVGAVDFMGVYPRLSSYETVDLRDFGMYFQGQHLRASLVPELRILGPAPKPDPNPDAGIPSDPLVIWPCDEEALVDEVDEVDGMDEPLASSESGSQTQYSLCLAPDALHKANISGGDGPHMDFLSDVCMDAPLRGDDWDGVPLITYLRTAFTWGGFPGLRNYANPPRDLLAYLCDRILPL